MNWNRQRATSAAVCRLLCRVASIWNGLARFEGAGAPVDSYGIGSAFLANDRRSNSDFTMDIVRVKVAGRWVDMPKVGRRPCDNPDLERVDLGGLD